MLYEVRTNQGAYQIRDFWLAVRVAKIYETIPRQTQISALTGKEVNR